MVFPVVGGNLLDTGYNIKNSARFDNTGGSALGGTFGTPTNDKKFTLSMWHKKSSGTTSGGQVLFGARSGYENIFLHEETVRWDWNNASSGTLNWAPFIRDQSAWYHFVFAQDTTQGTNTNRAKLYINGRQITTLRSGVTANYPGQNLATGYNVDGQPFYVSSYNGSAAEINGYLADVAFIDGSQLDPSYFGETDDNGVWIPKEFKNDVTFGNNGFFLEFQQTGTGTNSSGIGADTSGNDNHLSVTGLAAQDITTDTPTNNFATFNPLIAALTASGNATAATFSEGNCKTVTANSGKAGGSSTIQISRGKWYAEFEFEATNISGGTVSSLIGVTDSPQLNSNSFGKVGERANDVAYANTGNKLIGDSATSYGNTYTTGDIIGVAVDLDNNAIYFSKNGTFQNSGDPTSGSTKTGAIALTDPANTVEGGYYFAVGESHTETSTHLANFGNPPFSISSGNSDGAGHGNFEYAVPSGYFALCTKNLAQYG